MSKSRRRHTAEQKAELVHEVWSKRVSLPARPAGASRPVLQRHAGRRREDAGSGRYLSAEQAVLVRQ